MKSTGACYAMQYPLAFTVNRLDKCGATPLEVAKREAELMRTARDIHGLPLRIHTAGDASGPEEAAIIGEGAAAWKRNGGGQAWTYTHAHADIPRVAWGSSVSVLASIEHTSQGAKVLAKGYAPAVVVERFPNSAKAFKADGITWIPCVEQTRRKTCTECRLCFNADALAARKTGIAFEVHGSGKKRALPVLRSN